MSLLIFCLLVKKTTVPEPELDDTTQKTESKMRLEYTSLRLDPLYIKVACWTYLAIMYVIPFFALLLFNLRYKAYLSYS